MHNKTLYVWSDALIRLCSLLIFITSPKTQILEEASLITTNLLKLEALKGRKER